MFISIQEKKREKKSFTRSCVIKVTTESAFRLHPQWPENVEINDHSAILSAKRVVFINKRIFFFQVHTNEAHSLPDSA